MNSTTCLCIARKGAVSSSCRLVSVACGHDSTSPGYWNTTKYFITVFKSNINSHFGHWVMAKIKKYLCCTWSSNRRLHPVSSRAPTDRSLQSSRPSQWAEIHMVRTRDKLWEHVSNTWFNTKYSSHSNLQFTGNYKNLHKFRHHAILAARGWLLGLKVHHVGLSALLSWWRCWCWWRCLAVLSQPPSGSYHIPIPIQSFGLIGCYIRVNRVLHSLQNQIIRTVRVPKSFEFELSRFFLQ